MHVVTLMCLCVCVSVRYVLEDRSPYRRMAKQNGPPNQRAVKAHVMDDDEDDSWSFGSFVRKDAVKDSIPDQQLSMQELTLRYPSKEMYKCIGFDTTFMFRSNGHRQQL